MKSELKYMPKQLLDKLAKLGGIKPFDGPSNICCNDTYYAQYIAKVHNMTVDEVREAVEALRETRR